MTFKSLFQLKPLHDSMKHEISKKKLENLEELYCAPPKSHSFPTKMYFFLITNSTQLIATKAFNETGN